MNIIRKVNELMGNDFTKEDELLLASMIEKHSNCSGFEIEYNLEKGSKTTVYCEDCKVAIWSDKLKFKNEPEIFLDEVREETKDYISTEHSNCASIFNNRKICTSR